jgi:hypothetical protein
MRVRDTLGHDRQEHDRPESDMRVRDTLGHGMRVHDNWRHKKLSFPLL